MSCHYPRVAWRSRDPDDYNPSSGKSKLVFKPEFGWPKTRMELACGQCAGCRLDQARSWAIRCVHEASLHQENCFLTLTYDDAHLPSNNSLNKEDMQLFLKRLRKHYEPLKIRFFQCGEYGDQLGRPHHHCILFGVNFADRLPFKGGSNPLFLSDTLAKLWPHGFSSIGEMSFDSACYVARYVLKKVNGKLKVGHYFGRKPEYVTMSRRPGIGKEWYDAFKSDLYNHDRCVVRPGFLAKPPSYYDKIFEVENPDFFKKIKLSRRAAAKSNPDNNDDRRAVKAELLAIKQKKVPRSYENGI